MPDLISQLDGLPTQLFASGGRDWYEWRLAISKLLLFIVIIRLNTVSVKRRASEGTCRWKAVSVKRRVGETPYRLKAASAKRLSVKRLVGEISINGSIPFCIIVLAVTILLLASCVIPNHNLPLIVFSSPWRKLSALLNRWMAPSISTLRRKRVVVIGKLCIDDDMYFSRISSALMRDSDALWRSWSGTWSDPLDKVQAESPASYRRQHYY